MSRFEIKVQPGTHVTDWGVYRNGRMIGSGLTTEAGAKAFARRNMTSGQTWGKRLKWVPCEGGAVCHVQEVS